jgi:hypothetical protein
MLKQDDYVKAKLVEMAWRFCKSYTGGHMAGQLIMHTLANRVRVGWGGWLQVLDSVPKFMAENELPPLEHPPLWEPAFVKLLHAVDGIYDGSIPDASRGALYWGDLNRIERPWFKEKIMDARKDNFEGVSIPAHQRVNDMTSLSFWA